MTTLYYPLDGEQLLTLSDAARELPSRNGRNANPATLWRWATAGVRTPGGRVHLEHVRLGAVSFTSREAIRRFITRLNAVDAPTDAATYTRTPSQRRKSSERAEQQLIQSGC